MSGLPVAAIAAGTAQGLPAEAAPTDGASVTSAGVISTTIGAAGACPSAGTICADVTGVGVRGVDDTAGAPASACGRSELSGSASAAATAGAACEDLVTAD